MFFIPARMLSSEHLCAPWIVISSSTRPKDLIFCYSSWALINCYTVTAESSNQDSDCLTRRNVGLGYKIGE